MKLDKRHLVGSLMLLVASIVYNVWVFTRPAEGTAAAVSAQGTTGVAPFSPEGRVDAVAVVDITQLPAPPDVTLDTPPNWPRDPFADMRRRPEPEVVDVLDAPPAAEPNPVVTSILFSPSRRLAMIDGQVVRVGDVVSGVKVVEILRTAVIVESALGGRRSLSLTPPETARSR